MLVIRINIKQFILKKSETQLIMWNDCSIFVDSVVYFEFYVYFNCSRDRLYSEKALKLERCIRTG